ncbi:hypothetical protein JYU34_014034 [Plutella xylostella]|uniref:Uncharacterized protein n=2 Tax=Plutella xylostella TaxID=51655 RepID=A0ABQ7Q7K7_PLUXY|nr:uncharacterized protein LOC105394714 [Plutella xylostella]KAG7301186.1 hypothetical protein JYU34_014034 [Plutella xylostella]CAG9127553.1 unnamed protein product [Plutella xylostella]
MSLLTYKYYDTPEGHDIFKKVFVTSKYAALSGFSASVFDILLYSHPKGILATLGRGMYFCGPLVGMASAFTVTANVAQNMRGKNDLLNYFMGGVVSGAVFGAWQRSITVAVPAGVFLGACAVVKKTAVDEGWTLMPDCPHGKENFVSAKNDWTLVKDIPEMRGWTKGVQ